jgi:hypothetical protein
VTIEATSREQDLFHIWRPRLSRNEANYEVWNRVFPSRIACSLTVSKTQQSGFGVTLAASNSTFLDDLECRCTVRDACFFEIKFPLLSIRLDLVPEGRVPISVPHPKRDSRRCRFHHRSIAVFIALYIESRKATEPRTFTRGRGNLDVVGRSFSQIPILGAYCRRRVCPAHVQRNLGSTR